MVSQLLLAGATVASFRHWHSVRNHPLCDYMLTVELQTDSSHFLNTYLSN